MLRRARAVPLNALVWGLPLLVWQVVFLLTPAVLLVLMTFWTVRDFKVVADYNLENWTRLFDSAVFVETLFRTLYLAGLAASVAVLLAFPFAYALAFKVSPGFRRLAVALLIVPFFTSYLLRIYSWNFMLADQGPVNYILAKAGIDPILTLGTTPVVILGYLALMFPLLTLILVLTLASVDRSLIEAANNLGAGRWRSVALVVVPSIRVGIVLAAGFAVILSFGDVLSARVLGSGRELTLGILISDVIKEGVNFPGAAVIALVMVALLLVMLAIMTRLAFPPRRERPGREFAAASETESTVQVVPAALTSTRPSTARAMDPSEPFAAAAGSARRVLTSRDAARAAKIEGLIDGGSTFLFRTYIAICFLFIYLPLISLVLFSFADGRFPTLPWPGFTMEWYRTLGDDPEIFEALRNSIVVAATVGAIATVLGGMTAYFLNRWAFRGKGPYLGVVMIGPCIPLVILALTLFIFLSQIGLSGSLTAVIVSHVGLASAFAVALIRLRLSEMDRDLEQAAWNLGANEWQTIRRVVLPQALPAVLAAFFLTMAVSWDEFVISWFVSGFDTTLPVKIFNMIQGNVSPRINAIGSIVLALSFALVGVAMASYFVVGRLTSGSRTRVARASHRHEMET